MSLTSPVGSKRVRSPSLELEEFPSDGPGEPPREWWQDHSWISTPAMLFPLWEEDVNEAG